MTPLHQLLTAREERWLRRLALCQGGTVVTLTVNVPGPHKKDRRWQALWRQFCDELDSQLRRWPVKTSERKISAAGPEAHWVVDADSPAVKNFLMDMEEQHPLGRLVDLDVMDCQGHVLGRAELGRASRPCLCCGFDGRSCAVAGRHSLSDVLAAASALMDQGAIPDDFAWAVARRAKQALEIEAALWPKPGLVTPRDSGSHDDMDFPLLCKSATALEDVFARCVHLGAVQAELSPVKIWPKLRQLGQQGEKDMLAATGGVNTHKGALFQLGLLCAAVGRSHARGEGSDDETLCFTAASYVAEMMEQRLPAHGKPQTAGELAFVEHGLRGVKGEACSAFPLGRQGLVLFEQLRAQGATRRDASIQTLLFFVAQNDDTTVVHRGGIAGLRWLQRQSQQTLHAGGILTDTGRRRLAQLEQNCFIRHLSPGGSADLLAVVWFLTLMNR